MSRFGIAVLSLVGLAVSASSASATIPGYAGPGMIAIEEPWSPAAREGEKAAVGYMKIENAGEEADRLVGGSTPLADRLEIYGMSPVDGVMKM